MIYTGYYAAIKYYLDKFPNIALVSISGKPPQNWKYYHYKPLAPSYSIWKEYHDSTLPLNEKINQYTIRFENEILKNLNVFVVLDQIYQLTHNKNNILLCYEKPDSFCHRHLVAKWILNNSSLVVKELVI